MIFTTEQDIRLIENKRLSAELLFVLKLLFEVDDGWESNDGKERRDAAENLKRYYGTGCQLLSLKDALSMLMERGILVKDKLDFFNDHNDFNPQHIRFNQQFLKTFRKYSRELGYELRKVYPKFGYIDDKEIPLTSIKKFGSEEEMFTYYAKSINWSIDEHNRIISLIRWALEHKTSFVNINIESFIMGRMWDAIAEFKDGGNSGFANDCDDYLNFV